MRASPISFLHLAVPFLAGAVICSSKICRKIINLCRTKHRIKVSTHKEVIDEMMVELADISMTEEWAKYCKLKRKINAEKELICKLDAEESSEVEKLIKFSAEILQFGCGAALSVIAWIYGSETISFKDVSLIWPLPETCSVTRFIITSLFSFVAFRYN